MSTSVDHDMAVAPFLPGALSSDVPAVEVVELLLHSALEQRASDIHLESAEGALAVRFRVDGLLVPGPEVMRQESAVISRLKILANLDIAEKRRPQDGKFSFTGPEGELDVRMSTLPGIHGEKIVLRLLNRSEQSLSLDALGLLPPQREVFAAYLDITRGIILVSGPTGSGKTTTLYSALSLLNRPEVNILTVEDPVEYQLPGLVQTQVRPAIGYTFANALRTFLRQDPDIILVGEIRDPETARIAVRAALTGHLVLSTVHTNTALDTVTRLLDMGIEPYLLADSLRVVLAQRLVRKVCQTCGGEAPLTLREHPHLAALNGLLKKHRTQQAGKGCEECRHLGYRGREAVFEVVPIGDEMKEVIGRGQSGSALQKLAAESGFVSMEAAAAEKIIAGITNYDEVIRVLL